MLCLGQSALAQVLSDRNSQLKQAKQNIVDLQQQLSAAQMSTAKAVEEVKRRMKAEAVTADKEHDATRRTVLDLEVGVLYRWHQVEPLHNKHDRVTGLVCMQPSTTGTWQVCMACAGVYICA